MIIIFSLLINTIKMGAMECCKRGCNRPCCRQWSDFGPGRRAYICDDCLQKFFRHMERIGLTRAKKEIIAQEFDTFLLIDVRYHSDDDDDEDQEVDVKDVFVRGY